MVAIQNCVEFLQQLIRTPSLSGDEAAIARLVAAEMKKLRFDQVDIDEAGNVVGLVHGQGIMPAVMFNTHLDHVDVGELKSWPFPPFGGEIHRDRVWGRGAMDIKGPLAAQVYGVGELIAKGSRPPGDVYVSAVVQEEIGGLGARYLAKCLPPLRVVVGEATGNQLRRGHRGRTELILHVHGRSVHASVPERGINPLQVVAGFISRLEQIEPKTDSDLGPSSVAPTLIRTDQISPNVLPGEVWLTCDWRRLPAETKEDVRQVLQSIADRSLIPGATAEVLIPTFARKSFTGLTMEIPSDHPPFLLSQDEPAVQAAQSVLKTATGQPVEVGIWKFATDGGHFAEAGWTVIGYGPGEELLAHTIEESIAVADLAAAIRGNRELALHWTSATA